MGLLILAAVFVLYGVLYVVFAFREPPEPLQHWFRIPGIFAFFPEQHRARNGRLAAGLLLVIAPVLVALRVLFWSR